MLITTNFWHDCVNMFVTVQNILVLALVILCIAIIARQGFKTLTLRGRGRLGACCAKGCEAGVDQSKSDPNKPKPVQFMPVEMLARRR